MAKPTPPRLPKSPAKLKPRTDEPVFAQPQPSPDPTSFKNPVTDQNDTEIANLEPVPQPVGGATEPILTLAQTYGSAGNAKVAAIQQAKQIVFHSVGDTGSVIGPDTQSLVADKMATDFDEASSADVPSFFFHLGDVVYYFGEGTYYYDQFYEPFRNYPAPIVAIPGNHDGVVYPKDPAPTLDAFLRNFCAATPAASPDAGTLVRTTMIAPGVYFTFDAPFVRILGLYSNVLEDPGVISSQGGTNSLDDRQITFLTTALKRIKSENYAGAVIIAVHHPPYTGGSVHGGSPQMLADIDSACTAAGVWPHAVFSGHSHNYQRYTRTVNSMPIPFLVAGCGGHSPLSAMRGTYRTPYKIDDTLTLESYDDTDYGYLRVVVNALTLTIEFHPESDGGVTKTPDDTVTVNLQTRAIS
jgi:Calcineurin-like phosphoesterase